MLIPEFVLILCNKHYNTKNMNKYILTLLCTFFVVFANAQDKSKYLEGAVPEVGGKVIFSKTITPKIAVSDADLYDLMLQWAHSNYGKENTGDLVNRVLLENPAEKNIACYGEMYFVFRSNFIVLDRAKMAYQLIMDINSGKCDVSVRGIKYDYEENNGVSAEEMISDKVALNNKKDKLNRYYDKFRIRTVDSINQIFNSIDVYLNGSKSQPTPVVSQGAIADLNKNQVQEKPVGTMNGYKSIAPDKIPAQLMNGWTLITSGSENNANVMTALWGGTGTFDNKPVAFSILNPKTFSVKTMEKEDTYVVSFYTEIYQDALKAFNTAGGSTANKIKESGLTPIQTPSGATAFEEAWMIIECKKGTTLPSVSGANNEASSEGMSKEGFNQTYLGEILNIWVK